MKTIKHRNILRLKEISDTDNILESEFVCRGCTMRDRDLIWHSFFGSIGSQLDRENDNSYLTLEEEPMNPYDPDAVMVVCRGEIFGTVGYVGREYTGKVKEILGKCDLYRVDLVDSDSRVDREMQLLLRWTKQDARSGA